MNIVSGADKVGRHPECHMLLDGDGAWPDLTEKPVHYANEFQISALPGGMESGRTSMMLRVDLENGSAVVVETSLRMLETIVSAFRARYGDTQRFVRLNESGSPRG